MGKQCLSIKARLFFGGITILSVFCFLCAIDVSFGKFDPFWDILTLPIDWTSQHFLKLAQKLDPIVDDDTRKTAFAVLGLAGSIIPPVYKAEATRRNGILIKEMTDCYFPWYKFVMLINFALSLAGQHIVSKNMWRFLFLAIMVTAGYSVVLLLAIGFQEELSDIFMDRFIRKKTAFLQRKHFRLTDESRHSEHTKFLADLCAFLALKIREENTPYWHTNPRLKEKIRSVVPLILTEADRVTLQEKKQYGFLPEYEVFFSLQNMKNTDVCKGVYYNIPSCDGIQRDFANRIEFASVFWESILDIVQGLAEKAKVACRVYNTIVMDDHSGKLNESYLILGCGLIHYLYKKTSAKENGVAADYCACFINEMRNVYWADSPPMQDDRDWQESVELLCRDHMLLIWCISEIEQYKLARQNIASEAIKIIQSYRNDVSVGVIWHAMYDENINIYLSLAMCLIQRLPSCANRDMTLAQKRNLLSHVLNKKDIIGA